MKNFIKRKYESAQKLKKINKSKPIFYLNIIFILTIVSLGLAYFLQVNNIASKGYSIRDYEKEIAALSEENQHLKVEIVKLQSMNTIKEKIINMDLVEVMDLYYLDAATGSVAKK